MEFIETNLNQIYSSVTSAFPNCTRRENAIDEVIVTKLEWLPFIGLKTLRVKGLSQTKENGHEHFPEIVFKSVKFHEIRDQIGLVEIIDNIGARYLLEKLQQNVVDVLVKCDCKDYYWRFQNKNFENHIHQGRNRVPYIALYNPNIADISIGACKHIMKLNLVLNRSGLID